jgi:hypothetical protein
MSPSSSGVLTGTAGVQSRLVNEDGRVGAAEVVAGGRPLER